MPFVQVVMHLLFKVDTGRAFNILRTSNWTTLLFWNEKLTINKKARKDKILIYKCLLKGIAWRLTEFQIEDVFIIAKGFKPIAIIKPLLCFYSVPFAGAGGGWFKRKRL